jgi:Zn-dependent protease/CBS domain-containing protein
MFGTSWKLARIAGIDVRVDSSWLLIALFIGYSFFARFDALYDELSGGEKVALAAVAALAFFASVLLHEFAHALLAKARGIPVRGITLFFFGGATEAKVESRSPRDEFLIAGIGPLSSLVIAGVMGVVAVVAGESGDPVPGTIGYLAWVNLSLAVFNILPGLPLDGGRVLRSAIWSVTGDMSRATRIASEAGRLLGYALIGLGVYSLLIGAGGLWLVFIGWFLAQAAQASYAQLRLSQLLRGVTAEDVMSRQLVCLDADLALSVALEEYFLRFDHSAFPVVDGGRAVGLVTLRAVRRVPGPERPRRTVREVMTPLDRAPTVPPDGPLERVVDVFGEEDGQRVLVVDHDHVVGIVSPSDVNRWVRRSQELGRQDQDGAGDGLRI